MPKLAVVPSSDVWILYQMFCSTDSWDFPQRRLSRAAAAVCLCLVWGRGAEPAQWQTCAALQRPPPPALEMFASTPPVPGIPAGHGTDSSAAVPELELLLHSAPDLCAPRAAAGSHMQHKSSAALQVMHGRFVQTQQLEKSPHNSVWFQSKC